MAYQPKAILSTDFPSVSAQEYDVHGLCAQRISLASLPMLLSKSLSWIGASFIVEKCLQYSILPQYNRDIYR